VQMAGSSPAMTISFSIVITGLDPVIPSQAAPDGRVDSQAEPEDGHDGRKRG
jgi:hypothetical protein